MEPLTLTQLADEYARTAVKAEKMAAMAKSEAEREGLKRVAETWRELEVATRRDF